MKKYLWLRVSHELAADDGTGDLFPGTTDGGLGSRGSTTTIDDGTGPIDD